LSEGIGFETALDRDKSHTIKIEQMMEHLLAKIRTNQEEMTRLLKEEMLAKSDAHHKWIMARKGSQLEKMEVTMDLFEERLNKMDTTDLKANQKKSEAIV
jgi:hypothetical protein